jgi:acylphosphatase
MPEPVKIPVSMPLSTPEPILLKMPAPIRKRLIVSGNVQQTGYRVLVKSIARSMGIVGFVRNQPDETVEVVCEGEAKKIEQFVKLIDRKGDPLSPTDIDVYSIVETTPIDVGRYSRFDIEYNGKRTVEEKERDNQDRMESMILGASLLKQEVRCVGKDVQSMHIDMNKRFDHMADRYDMIALSLKDAIVHMDRNAEKTDKAIEKSRKETILEVQKSQKETAKILSESRKEIAASNRELANAVKFMIKKLSDKPTTKRHQRPRK